MKTRITASICAVAFSLSCVAAPQTESTKQPSVAVKAADAVIVRPISVGSTIVGSALFVVSLPVAAPLKKTKSVADLLVVRPAKATFKRPLGDMDAMAD